MAQQKKKKPPPRLSMTARTKALIKRNPIKSFAIGLTILAGIPGGVAGATYVGGIVEPVWYASHQWTRELIAPFIKTQGHQNVATDRILLYIQRKELDEAKKDPAIQTSPNAKHRLQEMEDDAFSTKQRLCKATGKDQDCKADR